MQHRPAALDGPLKVRLWAPAYPVAVLPKVSSAVMVSLKAVPAVWVLGVGTEKAVAPPAVDTVKLPDVPVIEPWVTVSVVVWASLRVTDAVPTPAVKVTDDG